MSGEGDGVAFDDIPLVEYEAEVLSECGAWKNFDDLEESLSLGELMELYKSSVERQQRLIKVLGSAMGMEFSDSTEERKQSKWEYDPRKGGRLEDIVTEQDVRSLPIGLGYTKIE